MPTPIFATIELKLRFTDEKPDWISGRALHGLAFRYIRSANPEISEIVHESEIKPFTISLLGKVRDDETLYRWRWTVLDLELYESLSRLFYSEWTKARERPLVGASFVISDCQMDGGGRSIMWLPEDLIENAIPDRTASIRIVSPAAFKMGGSRVSLFPEPALLWGGIARRLRYMCPDLPRLNRIDSRLAELMVNEYHLGTRQLEFPGYVMKGIRGRIAYEAPREWDSDDIKCLAILLQAAPFMGIGAKTTQGMGQCRIWKSRKNS